MLTGRGAPPPAPWSKQALWAGIALAIVLYIVVSAAGGALVVTLGWLGSPWIALVLGLGQLGLLLPPLVVMSRYGNSVSLLGLDRFRPVMLLETIVALGLGFLGTFAWGLVVFFVFDRPAQEPILPLFGEGLGAFLSAFLVGAVLAPVVEEVVFRGFLFGGLRRAVHPVAAAVGSSAIFGALHLQPLAFPALFLLGVLLALLYHRTGSLWPPILMHFCVNALGLVAQYLATQQGFV